MSRITDTERGARQARWIARNEIAQPDMFKPIETDEDWFRLWASIYNAAALELADARAYRVACAG